MYKKYIKRLLDIVLSLAGLILDSWLYVIVVTAIFIDDLETVFFTQKSGKGQEVFQIIEI
jgi:O-antigen biosynthesis protein WbqP